MNGIYAATFIDMFKDKNFANMSHRDVELIRHPIIWRLFIGFLGVISCTTLMLITWCSVSMENTHSLLHSSPQENHLQRGQSFKKPVEEQQLSLLKRLNKQLGSSQFSYYPVTDRSNQESEHAPNIKTISEDELVLHEAASSHGPLTVGTESYLEDHNRNSVWVLTGTAPLNNEFEVSPFTRFTMDRIYPVEPGLGRRVIEKPIGYKKREILAVIDRALAHLNENTQSNAKLRVSDFVEGVFRTVPSAGTHYELFFRDGLRYHKIAIVLPLARALVVEVNHLATQKERIHLVLALSGRVDAFRNFMKRYERLLIGDASLSLTVVYFGDEGLAEVKMIISKFTALHGSSKAVLISASGQFSRSHGLQIGVDSLEKSYANPLLFLCDVDVAFTPGFLERCRLHAVKGRSVYYPIVFSLYNPAIVKALNITGPSADKPISRDSGFWRDFGYGMTCQYRSDFYGIGGFTAADKDDQQSLVNGWGMEDVRLFRRHLQSGSVLVMRATDPGIFHIWHEKHCDPNLSINQYTGCLRSKAFSEASHAQLGMMLFKTKLLGLS